MTDHIAMYAASLGMQIKPRTILVEGTSDVALLRLVSSLEKKLSGKDLFGDFAIVAAGERDQGGVNGLLRELIAFRGMARTFLQSNGKPVYRFVGLFDNDRAGRRAIDTARDLDSSILEYKDVFRLMPVMPEPGNLDPRTVAAVFARSNEPYKGLDWELEDLVSEELIRAFDDEHYGAVKERNVLLDKTHHEFTRDGKAQLHRFVKLHGMREDLLKVVELIHALRCYLNLPSLR